MDFHKKSNPLQNEHINSHDVIYSTSTLDSNIENSNGWKTLNVSVADGHIIGYTKAQECLEYSFNPPSHGELWNLLSGFFMRPLMEMYRYNH